MKISGSSRRAYATLATISVIALAMTGCARGGGGSGDASDGTVEASPGITDTSITIGTTAPLTGNAAGVGNCAVDGGLAYFGAKNAEGGIEFGDGKTRTVEFTAYDDGYDPQRALANFQQMQADGAFAAALSLGTPTNRAWREAAIDAEFPQVLLQTGDPLFSNREESPWQLGLLPVYQQEGEAFGELLANSPDDHKVAILFQNDDFGEGYVEGFREAIEDADNVEVVKELGYEATSTDVNAQITDLASTDADVFLNAMSSLAPLVIGSLQQADTIGWHPSIFLPSVSASPAAFLVPSGVADTFPGIYTTASSMTVGSPLFTEDPNSTVFLDALAEYTAQPGEPSFPQCLWSWIGASILEQAFMKMEEPTRESFMEALRSISDYSAPFLLDGGVIDTTTDDRPAMSTVVVQMYNGAGFTIVDALD
ncbi:putative Amino acid-binding protein [Microbacterium sp. C448]|uniref:ABC transporter substrate-binding protein n=1 Tax=Microbacterium TaxID=33882 RepID=UPI0003DE05AA|nr:MULTISPECIES: ABC transporter substrate-binding protein [Microbacterium]CDK01163.1 putative Amino acid-binding protein [Microbacterium sp. C448]|tara:strand:- start:7064 stop:8338 length:1275 start_codon:yes stop_codon:yes gene_type:complete